jgi:hypothetical protein
VWPFAVVGTFATVMIDVGRLNLHAMVSGQSKAKGWLYYAPVWLLLVMWVVVLAALVASGLNATYAKASTEPLPKSCMPGPTAQPPEESPESPAVLKPHSTVTTGVPFGRNLDYQERSIEYDVTSNPEVLSNVKTLYVEKSLFQTAAGDRQLYPQDISSWAEVKAPTRVLSHVCFQRTLSTGPPGLYAGTISITDGRVARVDVPFNVSLSYPTWQFVFALWILAILPATLYVWLLLCSFTTTELCLGNFRIWIFSRNAIIALGSGVTISFGLVSSTYFRSDAWDANFAEATTLLGGAFAGFVAAALGVTGAGQDKKPPTQD